MHVLKLMLLITQVVASQVSQPAGKNARHIAVDFNNTSVRAAVQAVVEKSGVALLYSPARLPAGHRVTYRAEKVNAEDALVQVLSGTGIRVERLSDGSLKLVHGPIVSKSQGVIAGKVTDAKTGKGVSGATVSTGSERGVTTGEDGGYRLTGVSVGNQTVTIRLVGYAKQTRTVTVGEGATVTADFKLEPSASVLDQVVVTGTAVATELKAVPNAMTVITAKQIEERGITRIDQLFRGDIPGLFAQNSGSSPNAFLDEVTMFSRGVTSLRATDPVTGAFTAFSNAIKTYVDGVELADPKYLSQIDPKSVDRIEILAGPQASTIYGSNAINGVMQIFTKRGALSQPQVVLDLLSGWIENNFSNSMTPQHNYSAQLNDIEGRVSYNVGGSWNYMGAWTPAKQSARSSGFGGMRLEMGTRFGQFTYDGTLRYSVTQNRQRGDVFQRVTALRQIGWWTNVSASGRSQPGRSSLKGNTIGLNLGYTPLSWWSHELGIGRDLSDSEALVTARGYTSRADSTLRLTQSAANRRSVRYTTTAQIPVGLAAQAVVTTGFDGWQNLVSSIQVSPNSLTGILSGTSFITRQPGHNTGGFLQTQIGLRDRLFFTYGLRAEWNPNFGEDVQPNYASRYGLAYTVDIGDLTAKVRASYGQSTKPPSAKLKAAETAGENHSEWVVDYGNFDYVLANPDLTPEYQQGGEGGIEVYFGARGSLVVTRYNQTVDGLIAAPNRVDSARSIGANPVTGYDAIDSDGYGYRYQQQYLNIGSIRNQGWEFQGSMNVGPITTRGTYSWTKSRTIGITPKYRSWFTVQNGYQQYQPGATFQYLPEHTWTLSTTYVRSTSTIAFSMMGTGLLNNGGDNFALTNLRSNIRLLQNRMRMTDVGYMPVNQGYILSNMTALHWFSPQFGVAFQVDNLTDRYTNDYDASYAVIGRQVKAGLRMRWQ